jgi:predicted transcriptional regulator
MNMWPDGIGRQKVRMRRSHLEMRMDVLRAVREGADGPTQIMYRANLPWGIFCEHVKSLVQNGLLSERRDGDRKKYDLTGKGAEILEAYSGLVEVVLSTTCG